jgi:hypothetical protein
VIAREKQRKLVGGGTITDGTTDAKNASVDGPLGGGLITHEKTDRSAFSRITDGTTDAKSAHGNNP